MINKLTSSSSTQAVFEWLPTAAQATAYARTYGAANSLNQVTSQTQGGSTLTPTYDLNGNMTSDGVTSYSWTHGNRMSGATRSGMTATYAYDADNRRTRKTVNGVTTRMLWSGADELGEYDGTGTLIRRFVPTGTTDAERNPVMDDRLAAVDAAGTVTWFHTDHQGSVLATSNSAGQTISTANYSPYGEFGDGVSSVPTGSDFGYTGRQYDPETGLYQYRARYYSPRLGTFLSTDPVGPQDDPNLYLYVGLDPVNARDPTGMECTGEGQDIVCTVDWIKVPSNDPNRPTGVNLRVTQEFRDALPAEMRLRLGRFELNLTSAARAVAQTAEEDDTPVMLGPDPGDSGYDSNVRLPVRPSDVLSELVGTPIFIDMRFNTSEAYAQDQPMGFAFAGNWWEIPDPQLTFVHEGVHKTIFGQSHLLLNWSRDGHAHRDEVNRLSGYFLGR